MMDARQLSIELQSARNAVYSAVGKKLTEMEDQDIAREVFRTWRLTKALEVRAEKWVRIQGELEGITALENELSDRKKELQELEA